MYIQNIKNEFCYECLRCNKISTFFEGELALYGKIDKYLSILLRYKLMYKKKPDP